MGDRCDDPNSMGAVLNATSDALGGRCVYSICLAEGDADRKASYWGDINKQLEQVCEQLASVPGLAAGFHAVGFSQGGLFLRALVERCESVSVKTLVTMGSPHQGVAAVPGCLDTETAATARKLMMRASVHGGDLVGPALSLGLQQSASCSSAMALVRTGAYWRWVQHTIVQATYFKNPNNLETYRAQSILLADINNEKVSDDGTASPTAEYKARLQGIDRLVLFRFQNDTVLAPRDTAWFTETGPDGSVPFDQTPLYTEDRIGLKELHARGKLVFETAPGEHMHIALDYFVEQVVLKYLR